MEERERQGGERETQMTKNKEREGQKDREESENFEEREKSVLGSERGRLKEVVGEELGEREMSGRCRGK